MEVNEMKMTARAGRFRSWMKEYTVLCATFLVLSSGLISSQTAKPPVHNIILVHGAWADGSGWKGVYDILTKDGYNVSIVQEPETSFKDRDRSLYRNSTVFLSGDYRPLNVRMLKNCVFDRSVIEVFSNDSLCILARLVRSVGHRIAME